VACGVTFIPRFLGDGMGFALAGFGFGFGSAFSLGGGAAARFDSAPCVSAPRGFRLQLPVCLLFRQHSEFRMH
jgi:hypothetical protein